MENIRFLNIQAQKVDNAGGKITYEGSTDYGVYKDMYPITESLARSVFNDIKYPIEKIRADIILAPFGLMIFDESKAIGWTGARYQGRAYASHIIYGARKQPPTKDDIGSLIIHELGHNIMYDYYDCTYDNHTDYIQEFKDLRGISDWDNWPSTWHKRPAEIWAEDFRYLFGTEYMTDEDFDDMYKYIGPPGKEVREFFLNIADVLYEKHKDEIPEPIEETPIIEEPPNIDEPIFDDDDDLIIQPDEKESADMDMYLVRYGHLDKILVNVGQVCQADILWDGSGVSPATIIGIEGNTGLSTGRHTHIDVVKVPYDPNFRYKKYTQNDIHNNNPPPDKTELYYFLDRTLYKSDFQISTHFDSQTYFEQFNRVHKGGDIVSLGDTKLFWNRSTRGRVVHVGYDNAYGNHVVIAYFDVDFDSYEGEAPVFNDPGDEVEEIKMDGNNDLSKTWLNSVNNWMYHMTNQSSEETTYGQTEEFDGNVRYIKMHPNNLGIVTAPVTTDKIGLAGTNGTFFWPDGNGNLPPTSILQLKNMIIQGNANHLPYPQGVFCYYQDGTFGIEQVKSVNEISKPVWWAIGGIEYTRDNKVTYNRTAEGFVGKFDVYESQTHTSMGLTKEGKILLTRHWESTRADCAVQLREMGCIYALGLDGGGSTQYITPTVKKTSTRKTGNHLVATNLKV